MKIMPVIKSLIIGGVLTFSPISTKAITKKSTLLTSIDTFVKDSISAKGTNSVNILSKAPSADVYVQGVKKFAKYVVDLTENVLYRYDEKGIAQNAYLVGTGKKSTPTHSGIRIVSHVERYPYRGAPRRSKRRRTPRAFGPKAIILDRLDTKTGERSSIGEFIHGNNNASSIGKYVSHGCVRMDNEVILQLASEVKRGDIVKILPNRNLK